MKLQKGLQQYIAKHYFGLFVNCAKKTLSNVFKIKFNMDNETCYDLYQEGMNGYFYAIVKFNNLKNVLNSKTAERNFVGFIYRNVKFRMLNHLNYKILNKNKINISYVDEYYDTPVNEEIDTIDNYIYLKQKIDKYIDKFAKDKKKPIKEYFLNLIFNKNNYSYLSTIKYNRRIRIYSDFMKHVYELHKQKNEIRIKRNSYRSFKMLTYPILKDFLNYLQHKNNYCGCEA